MKRKLILVGCVLVVLFNFVFWFTRDNSNYALQGTTINQSEDTIRNVDVDKQMNKVKSLDDKTLKTITNEKVDTIMENTSLKLANEKKASIEKKEIPIPEEHISLISPVSSCNFGLLFKIGDKKCCICPQYSIGTQCQILKSGGKTFKKLTTCYGDWDGIDAALVDAEDKRFEMGEVTNNMRKYSERVLKWGSGRNTCNSYTSSNKIDAFFHELGMNYGPFTANDAVILHLLQKYNHMAFGISNITQKISTNTPLVPGKILFILMVHQGPDTTENLLRTIVSLDHYYILSISKVAGVVFREKMKSLVASLNMPNVIILPRKFAIEGAWSDVSLVYLEMAPVLYAFTRGWTDWSFKIALSETHFPVKKISELSKYLAKLDQTRIISDYGAVPRARIFTTQIFLNGLCRNMYGLHADLHHLKDIKTQGGSQWHVISRNILMHLLSGSLSLEYLFMTKHAAVPDEMYYPTVVHALLNSRSWELLDGSKINMPLASVSKQEILTFLEMAGPRAADITEDQFPAIEKSGKFFVRKVKTVAMAKKIVAWFKLS
jgi:hypothetical protein